MLAHQIGSQAWSWSSWTSQEPFLTCVSSSRSVTSSTPYNSVLNYTKNVCLHWENVPFIIFNSIQCYRGNVGKADWSSFNLTLLYLTDISKEECVFEPICSIVEHHFFVHHQGGPYHDVLHSILGAYTCYRPDVGYVSLTHKKTQHCILLVYSSPFCVFYWAF